MKPTLPPQDQVFWYLDYQATGTLTHDISTDVVVIGGGMAGLSAAQSFRDKGLDVVVLEKNYCGAGASGKSSGFITPNSELSLSDLTKFYGPSEAQRLWQFVESGVDFIADNIRNFNLECDYQEQDTLVVAESKKAFTTIIKKEYDIRNQFGYESTLFNQQQLANAIASSSYYGGIAYKKSFGIKAYDYCQGMKKVLQGKGVKIYEETPALSLADRLVTTPYANVRAQHIIVCVDRFAPTLNVLQNDVYQVQSFLMVSGILSEAQKAAIFPHQKYMVWDTDLVYHYFRITGDNRLMVGGADLLYTYASQESHNNSRVINKLTHYFSQRFADANVTFEYVWPGLIGISKDILPIAGKDKNNPSIYYVSAAAGLPWAAALGAYSVQGVLENDTRYEQYFSPYRKYAVPPIVQKILGKKITFALSNFLRTQSL